MIFVSKYNLLVFILIFFFLCSIKAKKIITINDVEFEVEIAETKEEHKKGLMYKDKLSEKEGMLFIFKRPRILSFWMKNTKIPLSIAFINKNRKITETGELNPYSKKPVYSEQKSLYALEVKQGTFEVYNIEVGDKVEFSYNR